ncbi:MAG: hypothetical protein EBW65_08945 [Gammaproteobacteria bacterium]|nr:hypothetical protein [Gammaproteobacteria bacterium]
MFYLGKPHSAGADQSNRFSCHSLYQTVFHSEHYFKLRIINSRELVGHPNKTDICGSTTSVQNEKQNGGTIMKISPLAPAIGGRIDDCDLTQSLNSSQVKQIQDAFLAHAVLLFPGQRLTHEDQLRAAQIFGESGTLHREIIMI